MSDKGKRKKKGKEEASKLPEEVGSEDARAGVASSMEFDPATICREFVTGEEKERPRVDKIRESHALLKQFSQKELKILMGLKRNTSPKAWTIREDLVVLSLPMSNREIAEILKDRNKEAVKKRLQLLRSKGLTKRAQDSTPQQ